MYYHQKLVISGRYFELYKYEKSLKRDFIRKKKKKVEAPHEQMIIDDLIKTEAEIIENAYKQKEKRKDSIYRTRTQIRRLINSNPNLTKFITLTFSENMTNITKANKQFNKFTMRLNYRHENFKYVAIIEFQKRGAVHYHFLCDLPYIKTAELSEIWKHGFVKINRIKHVDNIGAYVCKYLQKDMNDKRMFNRKKYFCSKNIEKPTTVVDDRIIEKIFLEFGLDNLKPDFENTFFNKFVGNVSYNSYKLKNPIA